MQLLPMQSSQGFKAGSLVSGLLLWLVKDFSCGITWDWAFRMVLTCWFWMTQIVYIDRSLTKIYFPGVPHSLGTALHSPDIKPSCCIVAYCIHWFSLCCFETLFSHKWLCPSTHVRLNKFIKSKQTSVLKVLQCTEGMFKHICITVSGLYYLLT